MPGMQLKQAAKSWSRPVTQMWLSSQSVLYQRCRSWVSTSCGFAFGQGQNLRWLSVHDLCVSLAERSRGILFFHAFTGCDVVLPFRGKGKMSSSQTCVKTEAIRSYSPHSSSSPTSCDACCLPGGMYLESSNSKPARNQDSCKLGVDQDRRPLADTSDRAPVDRTELPATDQVWVQIGMSCSLQMILIWSELRVLGLYSPTLVFDRVRHVTNVFFVL
jgi:hypothetical protein